MRKKNEQTLFFEPMSVKEHATNLIQYMSEGIYEKEHVMSMSFLSAIAGESVFLLNISFIITCNILQSIIKIEIGIQRR